MDAALDGGMNAKIAGRHRARTTSCELLCWITRLPSTLTSIRHTGHYSFIGRKMSAEDACRSCRARILREDACTTLPRPRPYRSPIQGPASAVLYSSPILWTRRISFLFHCVRLLRRGTRSLFLLFPCRYVILRPGRGRESSRRPAVLFSSYSSISFLPSPRTHSRGSFMGGTSPGS